MSDEFFGRAEEMRIFARGCVDERARKVMFQYVAEIEGLAKSPEGGPNVSKRGSTMDNITTIKHLAYDPERDMVSADLTGTVGGRAVQLQLRFPFRDHSARPGTDLRTSALAEMQQILRSAANITLPEIMNPADGILAHVGRAPQAGTDPWENEGGGQSAHRNEVVWVGI